MFKIFLMNILITGAGKGIGFELTRLLSVKHKVIAISRNIKPLQKLNTANISPISFDILSLNFSDLLIPFIKQHFQKIDIIINNAGVLINKPFETISPADYDLMFNTNVKAPYFMVQNLLPLLNPDSHIVNISSMGGFQGSAKFPGLSAYSASKGALSILSECLAEELKEKRISVNCLCLGAVQTEMLEQAFPGLNAPVSASDIAPYIADFALNAHKFINGKIIPVSLSTP